MTRQGYKSHMMLRASTTRPRVISELMEGSGVWDSRYAVLAIDEMVRDGLLREERRSPEGPPLRIQDRRFVRVATGERIYRSVREIILDNVAVDGVRNFRELTEGVSDGRLSCIAATILDMVRDGSLIEYHTSRGPRWSKGTTSPRRMFRMNPQNFPSRSREQFESNQSAVGGFMHNAPEVMTYEHHMDSEGNVEVVRVHDSQVITYRDERKAESADESKEPSRPIQAKVKRRRAIG